MTVTEKCRVPECKSAGDIYSGSGQYNGKPVCPIHTAALHAKNPKRKR